MIDPLFSKISLTQQNAKILSHWNAANEMGLPAAIWRLPFSGDLFLLVTYQRDTEACEIKISDSDSGYFIHPFHPSTSQSKPHFLRPDFLMTSSSDEIITDKKRKESILLMEKAQQIFDSPKPLGRTFRVLGDPQNEEKGQQFSHSVEVAVNAIRSGALQKVVLSKDQQFELEGHLDFPEAFLRLLEANPSAFVSAFFLPKTNEIWLGATPELLVSQNQTGRFATVSLAGTQKAHNKEGVLIPKAQIAWGQKEIEEQAMVSRYIVNCFKKIRLREYVETGPRSVLAGNVYHLRSDFEVDTTKTDFRKLVWQMLELLHPTSAVCGTPKEAASDLIYKLEGYDRAFYSGYQGPVNLFGETNLYVSLRNARIVDQRLTIFAGAGITADSEAVRELAEIKLKYNTLLAALSTPFY